MIHHVSLGTNDVARARAFYDPLMALIGLRVLKASPTLFMTISLLWPLIEKPLLRALRA